MDTCHHIFKLNQYNMDHSIEKETCIFVKLRIKGEYGIDVSYSNDKMITGSSQLQQEGPRSLI